MGNPQLTTGWGESTYWINPSNATPAGNKISLKVTNGRAVIEVPNKGMLVERDTVKFEANIQPLDGWTIVSVKFIGTNESGTIEPDKKRATFTMDFRKEPQPSTLLIGAKFRKNSDDPGQITPKEEYIAAHVSVADLDTDSDNNTYSNRTHAEDLIENPAIGGPVLGKLITYAPNLDLDNDTLPDFADFDGIQPTGGASAPWFPGMSLFLDGLPWGSKVRFIYSASDPAAVQQTTTNNVTTYEAAPGHLRVWTKNAHETRKTEDILAGGDYVTPSTDYTLDQLNQYARNGRGNPGQNHFTIYIEPIRPSTQTADQTVEVQLLYPGATDWISLDKVSLTLLPARLLVDMDRNRTLDDADLNLNRPQKPHRFWINDDDDWGETGTNSGLTGQGPTDVPGQAQAWSNPNTNNNGADYSTDVTRKGIVDGVADFVDFFPVFLDIKQLLGVLKPSTSIRYKLKHNDEALNFVYTKLTRSSAFTYQFESTGSTFGDLLNRPLKTSETHQITNAGIDLAKFGDTFLNGIKNSDWGVILIEGRAATTDSLRLVVEKDGVEIAEIALHMKISAVEDMYRRINLRDSNGQPPTGLVGDFTRRDGDLGLPTNLNEPPAYPDSLTNGKWFVFVVGSNVGGKKMRAWQSEIFKRLHWSQSKARFVGVSWYGDAFDDGSDLVYNYHSSVRNAFASAGPLANRINALSGTKTIAGHSAAAMLISSAVADHGLNASNTCLLNAAMGRECYDGAGTDNITAMVPAPWQNYPPELWASRWHQRFAGTNDARRTLTWRDRFAKVAATPANPVGNALLQSTVHNFYSPTEQVLGRFDGTVDQSVIENLRAPGAFAWVIQEKAKGDKLRLLFNQIKAGSNYGGWGFNIHDPITSNLPKWYLTNNNAQRVPLTPAQIGAPTPQMLADIKIQPFFRTGWGRYYNGNPAQELVDTSSEYYTGPSWIFDLYRGNTGDALAADPVKNTQLLNEAIPALSLALGANSSIAIQSRNYNMPQMFATRAGWPRLIDGASNLPLWHHNDMREVAYVYVHDFYDQLSSIAN